MRILLQASEMPLKGHTETGFSRSKIGFAAIVIKEKNTRIAV